MDDLVKWNNITNNTIHPGQVIIGSVISNPEATKIAKELGYRKTKEISHGNPVYENKKGKPKYISPDKDIHSGGYWKGADKINDLQNRDRRKGTYSKDLKERIGD